MDQDHIDTLLERYLSLLDEYTRLRTRIATLQSDVFQGIARANFSAERGLRYGRDQYDDRMQAIRLLSIRTRDPDVDSEEDMGEHTGVNGLVDFTIAKPDGSEEKKKDREVDSTEDSTEDGNKETPIDETEPQTDTGETVPPSKESENEKPKPNKSNDPLRWFGLLTPMPLRSAQAKSVEAVEQVIPRLATVSAEMLSLEIEVRRARKKRAKAEAVERKEKEAKPAGGDYVTATTNTAVEAS